MCVITYTNEGDCLAQHQGYRVFFLQDFSLEGEEECFYTDMTAQALHSI